LLSSNISSICPHNIVNFGPLAAEIVSLVWGTLQISTGLASWQRYCTAHSSSGRQTSCGVEQRAPPIFARAAITLGIGPHLYSCIFFSLALTVEALQGKTCQDSLLSGGVGQFEPRFHGKGSSLGNIFWFLQT